MKRTFAFLMLIVILAACPVLAVDWHEEIVAHDFVIQDNYVYVASYNPGFKIFDITDPLHPELVGTYFDSSGIGNIAVNDTIAYVGSLGSVNAGNNHSLVTVDISDPENPREIGVSDSVVNLWSDLVYLDGYIFTMNELNSHYNFIAIDVSDPENPEVSGNWFDEEGILGRAMSGSIGLRLELAENYVFVTFFRNRYANGTIIIDISDPVNPELIAQIDQHWGNDLLVTDNLLYIFGNGRTANNDHWNLAIYDISEVNDIQFLCSFPTYSSYSVFARNNLVYMVNVGGHRWIGGFAVKVIDFSDVETPEIVNVYNYLYGDESTFDLIFSELYVDDEYLYFGDSGFFGIYQIEDVLSAPISNTPTPTTFHLNPAYPNPFNSQTTVSFTLPQASSVNLTMYDILGREVSQLTPAGWLQSGQHNVTIDANRLSGGNYLLRLEAGDEVQVQPITLVK